MRYHWVQDRVAHGNVLVYWAPGDENLADYFTKHHHPIYHQRLRNKYLQDIDAQYPPYVDGEGMYRAHFIKTDTVANTAKNCRKQKYSRLVQLLQPEEHQEGETNTKVRTRRKTYGTPRRTNFYNARRMRKPEAKMA